MPEVFIRTYEELSKAELLEILRSRQDVFVVEQNCPYPDIDDHDLSSIFIFVKEDGKLTASMRMFERDPVTVQMGRILTLLRGKGYGRILLETALAEAKRRGFEKVYIEAQTYAVGFYGRFGFRVTSGEFLEDGIPHVCMECVL